MSDPREQREHETEDVLALIARCQRGDQSGYAALFDRCAPGLYRLCYSLLLNAQDAEDIVQDSFVYAFKRLNHYDPAKAAFRTWLYTIAVSRCRNHYRRRYMPTLDFSQLAQIHAPAPEAEQPESALARQSASDAIAEALASLSPPLREAVVLRYGHGLTYREMADVIGCPPKTAESRVRLAHDRLRRLLHDVGPGLLEELLRA